MKWKSSRINNRKHTKKKSRARSKSSRLSSCHAVVSAQADPEDDVRYASILHATNSAAGIWGGEDQVTYSTVGAPSPSAGAAAPDPNSLYTTVNKLNR